MTEFANNASSPFRMTETVNELGRRTLFVDGNTAEAEALPYEEFWKLIVGESKIKAFVPTISQNLQEFFGREESPDELIVVSPLRGTRADSPIRAMVAACHKSFSAITGAIGGLYLPAYFWEEPDYDTIIAIEQNDWTLNLPKHDSDEDGFTIFRATKALLPKDFLSELAQPLTAQQREIMLQGLE